VILTSNQSFGAWGRCLGDRIIATAILDRLLHHAVTLNIRGNSYRLKEQFKAGLVRSHGLPLTQPRGPITEYVAQHLEKSPVPLQPPVRTSPPPRLPVSYMPQKRTTRPSRTVKIWTQSASKTLPLGRARVRSQPRTVTLSPSNVAGGRTQKKAEEPGLEYT